MSREASYAGWNVISELLPNTACTRLVGRFAARFRAVWVA